MPNPRQTQYFTAIGLLALATPLPSAAAEPTVDAQPVAAQLADRPAAAPPVGVSAIHYGDSFANIAGGLSRGATCQGRLGLIADANLEAFGWQGATVHLSLHQIHGVVSPPAGLAR